MIDETVLRLAIAVLPGLMNRYGEAGYTDSSAIYEAFNLAHDCIREIRKTSKFAEAASSAIHNTGSLKCLCETCSRLLSNGGTCQPNTNSFVTQCGGFSKALKASRPRSGA